MNDVTAVLPIKGEEDLYRFEKILRPSLLKDLKLLIITDEHIDEADNIRIVRDEEIFTPEYPMTGWGKQQVLKIKSYKEIDTKWILTLDADCFFKYKGSVSDMFCEGKPYVNSATVTGQPSHELWWDMSIKALSAEMPSTVCHVTPMFLRSDICKVLDEDHDVEWLIKNKCTEYTLYWLKGLLQGLVWEEEYTFKPLLTSSVWYESKTYSEFLDEVKHSLGEQHRNEGALGLVQSAAQRKYEIDYIKIVDDISCIIDTNLNK